MSANNIISYSEVCLAYDKAFVKKINENPSNKGKMKPCRCGLGSSHQSFHGSLRFCTHFVSIPKIEERKQMMRTRKVCSRCLKMNHSAATCKLKPPVCYYCKKVDKPSNHSSALCLGHNNETFKAFITVMEKEKKNQQERKESDISQEERSQLKRWLWADYILYER